MRSLVKITAVMTSTEAILLVVVFVKNKFLATTIGTEGFGMYGLLSSFFDIAMIFSGTWLGSGITRYVSQYFAKGETESVNILYTFSLLFSVVVSLLMIAVFLFFQNEIGTYFLANSIPLSYYNYFAIAFFGNSLRPLFISFLTGVKAIKEITYSRIFVSIADVICTLILVSVFSLTGFFMSVFFMSVISLIVTFRYVKQYGKIVFMWNSKTQGLIRNLFRFSAVSVILGLLYYYSSFLMKRTIQTNFDLHYLGLFQAGFSLMTYVGLALKGSDYYYFPKMSESLSSDQRYNEFNQYFQFTIAVSLPITMLMILFGKDIVILLFNDRFVDLVDYLFLLVIAQFITDTLGKSYGNLILGTSRLLAHSISSLLISISWAVLPLLFVGSLGFASVFVSVLIGSVVSNAYRYYYSRFIIGMKVNVRNRIVLFLSTVGIILSVLLKDEQIELKSIVMFSVLLGLAYTYKTKILTYFYGKNGNK